MTTERSTPAPTLAFPRDLRSCFDPQRLALVALEAAADLGVGASGPLHFRHADALLPVGPLLAMITYSYLTGRLGSEEIEEALGEDAVLGYLAGSQFPSSTAIRRFRRLHRGPLSVSLFRALRAVAEELAPADFPREALARTCASAAEALLGRAVLADTMALDV